MANHVNYLNFANTGNQTKYTNNKEISRCMEEHRRHEWIPTSQSSGELWEWIISPLNDKVNLSLYGDKEVSILPKELKRKSVKWYYVKDSYFEHHCELYHKEDHFKPHVSLYSQQVYPQQVYPQQVYPQQVYPQKSPDYHLALIDSTHKNFKFIDSKEYQDEEMWYSNKSKTSEVDRIFADAMEKSNLRSVTESGYSNYVSQASNGNVGIVLPILGFILGLALVLMLFKLVPDLK